MPDTTSPQHGQHGERGHRTHKFNPANVERLLSDERKQLLNPEPTLRAAGIGAGQTVVDLGCGPGFFTLPAAQLVGASGKIYAVDLQPEMVETCRSRAAEAGIAHVDVLQSSEASVPLPDGVADRVFVAFVLHEADDQAAFMREIKRLLKPGGEVAFVEWQMREGPPGPPMEHRVSTTHVMDGAHALDLRVIETIPLNDHHILIRLSAPR